MCIRDRVTQGLAARRAAHAAAKVDDRAFRFIDEPCGFLDLLLIIAGHGSDQLRLLLSLIHIYLSSLVSEAAMY